MSSPMEIDGIKGRVKEEPVESCGSLISDAQSKSPNFSVKMKEEEKEENRGGYGFVNALHAIVKADMDDLIVEGRKKIGAVVTKELDGRRYMGNVVAFDALNNSFKVEYDDGNFEDVNNDQIVNVPVLANYVYEPYTKGNSENVNKNQIDRRVTPPLLANYLYDSDAGDNKGKEKISTGNGSGNCSTENKSAGEEAKSRKRGRSYSNPTGYVPLAFREKKRDCYYWY